MGLSGKVSTTPSERVERLTPVNLLQAPQYPLQRISGIACTPYSFLAEDYTLPANGGLTMGNDIKISFSERVMRIAIWLWEAPITWGQVLFYIFILSLDKFVRYLFHLFF
jgi:hypothetical protein